MPFSPIELLLHALQNLNLYMTELMYIIDPTCVCVLVKFILNII